MNKVIHPSDTRGYANHGWLKSHHTFSFAGYYNPECMHFGALRVLNDDYVEGGKGFGTHPHENMEIITIPLEGDLEHKDNMGNDAVIQEGNVQVMSAGTGVMHSEMNHRSDRPVKFLQIWMFPNKQNVTPRYDEISIEDINTKNTWGQILSPNKEDEGVWVHQNAWFHLGEFDADQQSTYELKNAENGLYVFVLDGAVEIGSELLNERDAVGITESKEVKFNFKNKSRLLLMEVPMQW